MKTNFFTTLIAVCELKDKETFDLKITRTGDELTILATPVINGKTTDVIASGTPEEFDTDFFQTIRKPIDRIAGLKSNAEASEIKDQDEDLDEEKPKAEKKKEAPKKKEEPKKKEKPSSKKKPEEKASAGETKTEVKEEPKNETENQTAEAAKSEEESLKKESEQAKTKANDLLKEGDDQYIAKNFELAEEAYKKASEIDPDNAVAKDKYLKTKIYVNRLIDAGIIEPRKEA